MRYVWVLYQHDTDGDRPPEGVFFTARGAMKAFDKRYTEEIKWRKKSLRVWNGSYDRWVNPGMWVIVERFKLGELE